MTDKPKFGEWQPIETAKKDGSRIWACNRQMEKPVIVEWREYIGIGGLRTMEWVCTHDPWERWQPLHGRMIVPTHWMPLPGRLGTA